MSEILFRCPQAERCGGCQLARLPYAQQLDWKQRKVERLLSPFCKVEPIRGMENPFHYRNKVHAVLTADRSGRVYGGVYEPRSHRVVPVEQCLLEDERADAIIRTVCRLMPSFKLKPYDEDRNVGLMRHVLVRAAREQILVALVTASPVFPGSRNFADALRKAHPEITTIVQNVNSRRTSMVLGDRETVLYGRGFIEDTLCGKTFELSAQSFYQVNARQTELLYQLAIERMRLTGRETLLDAYCGVGTIGLCAADGCARLIGVELNPQAVADAQRNARRNHVSQARFFHDDAGRFLTRNAVAPDVLVMDPPRSGSDLPFLRAALHARPRRIVYVSCDPTTLARDLAVLTRGGYRAESAVPVDMFPATEHVETVVSLQRV